MVRSLRVSCLITCNVHSVEDLVHATLQLLLNTVAEIGILAQLAKKKGLLSRHVGDSRCCLEVYVGRQVVLKIWGSATLWLEIDGVAASALGGFRVQNTKTSTPQVYHQSQHLQASVDLQ